MAVADFENLKVSLRDQRLMATVASLEYRLSAKSAKIQDLDKECIYPGIYHIF